MVGAPSWPRNDRRSIMNILVFGDSGQVILNMCSGYCIGFINCKKFYDGISHINLPPRTTFYHILRSNNALVDFLANKGASLPQGSMVYNDKGVIHKFIP